MKLNFQPDYETLIRLTHRVDEQFYETNNDSTKPVVFATVELSDGTAVGALQFSDIDASKGECYLGAILPDRRGFNKGFLSVILQFLTVGFGIGLQKVFVRPLNSNVPRWCDFLGFENMSLTKEQFERKWLS